MKFADEKNKLTLKVIEENDATDKSTVKFTIKTTRIKTQNNDVSDFQKENSTLFLYQSIVGDHSIGTNTSSKLS